MSRAGVFVLILVAGSARAAAQQARDVVGYLVRLKTDPAASWLVGKLVAADSDSVRLLRRGGAPEISLPIGSVSRFEVRERTHSIRKGAVTGFAVGLLTGVFVGFAEGDDETGFVRFSATDKAVGLGLLGGGAGAVVGALIGATRQDRWVALSVAHHDIAVAPHGIGLTVSLRL